MKFLRYLGTVIVDIVKDKCCSRSYGDCSTKQTEDIDTSHGPMGVPLELTGLCALVVVGGLFA